MNPPTTVVDSETNSGSGGVRGFDGMGLTNPPTTVSDGTPPPPPEIRDHRLGDHCLSSAEGGVVITSGSGTVGRPPSDGSSGGGMHGGYGHGGIGGGYGGYGHHQPSPQSC
jgi:hypothetical protein